MTDIQWTDAEREAVAYKLIHHYLVNPPAGDCSCGHVVPLGHSFPAHQADEVLNALSDPVAARAAQAVQDFIEKRDRPVIKVETAGEAKFLVDGLTAEVERLRARLAAAEDNVVPHPSHHPAGEVECCASGRCEVCTPGYDWGRDG